MMALPFALHADTVVMKTGVTMEGEKVGEDDLSYELKVEYGTVRVPKDKILRIEQPTPEEAAAAGILRVQAAGHWDAAAVETGLARSREIEEPALAEDWVVALDPVAIEGIVPVTLHVRCIGLLLVAAPLGHGDVPAVRVG